MQPQFAQRGGRSILSSVDIFDQPLKQHYRQRASANFKQYSFVYEHALSQIKENIQEVKRSLPATSIIDDWYNLSDNAYQHAKLDSDEMLHCTKDQDAIISFMTLHSLNDPVGHLIQAKQHLKPDGVFLAIFLGGESLSVFKQWLQTTELSISGGISPRIAPMMHLNDAAALLQRAGYSLPMAIKDNVQIEYSNAFKLAKDLRGSGCQNNLSGRHQKPLSKEFYKQMNQSKPLTEYIELFTLTGWKPHESQPQPLKRGSGQVSLKDVL